jgi:nucleoside-diphosphate-sugar epimerase
MEVFLTGATGYIGAAVAEHLAEAGHSVTGLARSDEAARKLSAAGIRVLRGDVRQPETVAAAARGAGGVIHTALAQGADTAQVERDVADAIIDALAGTKKPFIYTSGIWVLGNTGARIADESAPLAPPPLVAWRPAVEQLVLEAFGRGVRGIVIRPAMVYGRGGGVLKMLLESARRHGAARYIDNGENRWSWVHVDDLADLYVRLLDAPAGTLLMAASGPAIPVREVAAAVSRVAGLDGKTEPWPFEEARKELGGWVEGLALDQQVSARRAELLFQWRPKAPSVFQELEPSRRTA